MSCEGVDVWRLGCMSFCLISELRCLLGLNDCKKDVLYYINTNACVYSIHVIKVGLTRENTNEKKANSITNSNS